MVGLVVKRVICSSDAVFGLVIVKRPERQVKSVSSDVDKRTTALLVFVEKNAPCRNCAAAYRRRLGVVDITKGSCLDLSLEEKRIGAVETLIAYRQLFAVRFAASSIF